MSYDEMKKVMQRIEDRKIEDIEYIVKILDGIRLERGIPFSDFRVYVFKAVEILDAITHKQN